MSRKTSQNQPLNRVSILKRMDERAKEKKYLNERQIFAERPVKLTNERETISRLADYRLGSFSFQLI